ncbi:MAG: hypothetical protein U0Y82_10080 [Thermoleophilia bacterium]
MADDERFGSEGDTGRKPLPRPDSEFADLDDSFGQPESAFFEEYIEEPEDRPEPEDFGFDDIATDDEPAPPRRSSARARGVRGRGVRSGGARRSGGGGGGRISRPSLRGSVRGGGGGGSRRGGSGGGGGSAAGLQLSSPAVRIGLGVLFAVIVIAVLALLIRSCRHDALVDSYKSYVNNSAKVSEDSGAQGQKLLGVLSNNRGATAAQLQKQLKPLEAQADQLTQRASKLNPPGRLSDANRQLVSALSLRADGLRLLDANIPSIISSGSTAQAATNVKKPMQMFLASDVLMNARFLTPAAAALRSENITSVQTPDAPSVTFLAGANDNLASTSGAQTVVSQLRHQGGTGSGSGNLRGTSLVSVFAGPSPRIQVQPSGTTLKTNANLKWLVTVKNGGDYVENNIKVTVTLTYPDNPNTPVYTATGTISLLPVGKEDVATVAGPASEKIQFAKQGTLTVTVEKVEGERNTANNSATYPVTFTF